MRESSTSRGPREGLMVTRRGRGNTVCTRSAWWALFGGPSTSPLGVSHEEAALCRRCPSRTDRCVELTHALLVRLSGGCFTQRLSTVTSPGGRAVATLELAQCKNDQPTGILVWVTVLPESTQHLGMQATPQSTDVRLTWQNDRSLIVVYPETVHPETKWSGSVPGVTVEFHPSSVYSQN